MVTDAISFVYTFVVFHPANEYQSSSLPTEINCMKTIKLISIAIASIAFTIGAAGQSPFRKMELVSSFSRPIVIRQGKNDHEIRGLFKLADNSVVVFTEASLMRSSDNGTSWQKLDLPLGVDQTIASAISISGSMVVLTGGSELRSLELMISDQNATSWTKKELVLPGIEMLGADLIGGRVAQLASGELELTFILPTSSNFTGFLRYVSSKKGNSWQLSEREMDIRSNDEADSTIEIDGIRLETNGSCVGYKTGCVQESKVTFEGNDITPPQVKQNFEKARTDVSAEATPMFAAPPGGTTRISLNRGFDKCTAAPVSQMQAWWNTSWFYDSNIYISGRNRGCTQAQLTATWVNQVSVQGWGLIPTIVGYQSPCINSTSQTIQKHSNDPSVAETQGRGEADIAIADANALGLTQGTVLYYDMERYDETAQTSGCRTATVAFLKGWTERVRELGYISGTYGSPKNAIEDWQTMSPQSRMDAIWMARWDNVMTVWTYLTFANFPTNVWNNHQRIKQWQAPHNETWGGFTFNIDGNISDAPVAGLAVAKNKNADFDGDGKTDISVYRPETGVWYVVFSATSTFGVVQFGNPTDIVSPGDFDGDGKTDHAVFRPADGTWHMLLKGGNYRAVQFGSNGDIPAPGDFNGDGKTDFAIFRPSTGVWYIANSDSLGTYRVVQFGLNGDKPVAADYDGDGKTDIAVFRPSDGVWFVYRSSDGGYSLDPFGLPTDRPAQGDYDGDGKTDLAVYRPSEGLWFLYRTTEGSAGLQFGIAEDIPSVGDYDGDGKTDVAVFRPSTATWYLLQSTNGVSIAQFGFSTDKSVPSAYLPQ